jgi:thioredoxin-like negative regulator of GroEL
VSCRDTDARLGPFEACAWLPFQSAVLALAREHDTFKTEDSVMSHPTLLRSCSRIGIIGAVLILGAVSLAADNSGERLTSRRQPPTPPEKAVEVGTEVRTEAGQRRRLVLPDGSILYVNEKSTVKLAAKQKLVLTTGEIFVETTNNDTPLVIQTVQREISGRVARVRLSDDGANVVVTGGQVKVGDLMLRAGQQLLPKSDKPVPAVQAAQQLDWTRDLMASADTPLVPKSAHTGGSLLAIDPDGQEMKLGLRKYHIDVHIEDGFARTTIDQTYFNHEAQRLEGTFYFPLPPDASLSRLAMYVDGNLMEGGMAERDYARNVYEEVVYRQKDPALLEWVDGSTFKMRVFPLEARQEKRIILSYSQRLPAQYGRLTYRFPAGHSLGIVQDWSFHALVKDGAGMAWNAAGHNVKARTEGGDLLLDAAEKGVKTDRDVVVALDEKKVDDAKRVRFSAAEQDSTRYLMLRYRPNLPGQPERQRRDWVFLFESSGDRDPLLARVQIDVIRCLLSHAGPDDTFAVLAAGTRVQLLARQPQPVTPTNVAAMVAFLEDSHLIGALDLEKALGEAAPLLRAAKDPYLIHVGSGIAALGEQRTDKLVGLIPLGTRYVGVGVGRRWGRTFMKAVAQKTGGALTQINPDEPVSWRAFELAASFDSPRIFNVKVVGKDGKAFLSETTTIAQGEEICAVCRSDGDLPEAVTVSGTLGGRPFEQTFHVKVSGVQPNARYLPRTWAKLEIDRLLIEDAVKHKEQIVALSKAMYVMSPFTSLLVLENEEMYVRYKVDRGRKDHWALYPSPAKVPVVYEPLPGMPADARNLAKEQKPNARQVLNTIGGIATQDGNFNNWSLGLTGDLPISFRTSSFGNMPVIDAFAVPGVAGVRLPQLDRLPRDSRDRVLFERLVQTRSEGIDATIYTARIPRSRAEALRNQSDFVLLSRTGAAGVPYGIWNGASDNDIHWSYAGKDSPNQVMRKLMVPGDLPVVQNEWERIWFADQPNRLNPDRAHGGISTRSPDDFELFLEGILEHPRGRANFNHGSKYVPAWQNPKGAHYPNRGSDWSALLYKQPAASADDRPFFDLASYCPGMTPTWADMQAVIDAEAAAESASIPGKIDDGARKLIDRARSTGWQALTFPAENGQPGLTIRFDGQGRYAWERTLTLGLRERVVCDGKTILHLYPDLGIGAHRTVGRAHRLDLSATVPWFVPPADDLARGNDVKRLDDHTVIIIPRDTNEAKDAEGKVLPYVRLHLVFAADGTLSERQLVEMPAAKVLVRDVLGADGTVRLLDADGKEKSVHKWKIAAAAAPDLTPQTKGQVLLPLPYRTPEYVNELVKKEKKEGETLSPRLALLLFAAEFGRGNSSGANQVFREQFFNRDRRQIGFYVLLASCGQNLDAEHGDVLAEHPNEPLAQYLALYSSPVLRKHASQWAVGTGQWREGYLQHLAVTHAFLQRWQNGKFLAAGAELRRAEIDKALTYIRQNKNSPFAWTLLGLMQQRAKEEEKKASRWGWTDLYEALVDGYAVFADTPGLRYASRYEQARCLMNKGGQSDKRSEEARKKFRALYEETLHDGLLPPIDADFRYVLLPKDEWGQLIRQTADKLIADKHRLAVLVLARQCWQLGDEPLANHLLDAALDKADDKIRFGMTLAGIDFLMETGQYSRADQLLDGLLADPKHSGKAMLWRLGALLAERRDRKARQLECLEHALDAEYGNLPEVIDISAVRKDYERLLAHYESLAEAMVTLQVPAPADFHMRVVKAADRWRALDTDGSKASQVAARILRLLGDRELAWDYATTPIALQPGESTPWVSLAQTLGRQGELDLADRAFAAAFAAQPTDAQILWDRAQNLRQAGKRPEADKLLRQLAEGNWQPRFQALQAQARWHLNGK